MRNAIVFTLLLICFGCNSTRHANVKPNPLAGTWLPVSEEMGGTALPPASFATQKLIISDSSYTFIAESVDKGVVRYNGDKMDIYGREGVNTGKHFMAIYKYGNRMLTICYNLRGNAYPEAFDTKGKPLYFLCTFKKQ